MCEHLCVDACSGSGRVVFPFIHPSADQKEGQWKKCTRNASATSETTQTLICGPPPRRTTPADKAAVQGPTVQQPL